MRLELQYCSHCWLLTNCLSNVPSNRSWLQPCKRSFTPIQISTCNNRSIDLKLSSLVFWLRCYQALSLPHFCFFSVFVIPFRIKAEPWEVVDTTFQNSVLICLLFVWQEHPVIWNRFWKPVLFYAGQTKYECFQDLKIKKKKMTSTREISWIVQEKWELCT